VFLIVSLPTGKEQKGNTTVLRFLFLLNLE
jgi:hypothetical protein